MRTAQHYLQSLNDGREIYYRGEKVSSILEHPTLRVAALHASKLYGLPRLYHDEQTKGDQSKYYKIPLRSQDLVERYQIIYDHTMACNGVFNILQAIGSDALFSLLIVSKKVDRKYKTNYAERVERYYQRIAKNDLTLAVAQTDVKGDRGKRPHEQEDPDMYLRIVDIREDGIVVNGAKAHTTQSAVSDEIIVLPTRAMTERDREYAIAFALPTNSSGLKLIVRPVEELEGNTMSVLSRKDYEFETLTIFDKVRVPWENVFLCREHEFAGPLAAGFVSYHRFTAISYRAATSNLYLGTASLISKANGVSEASHVRNNLITMITYKETMKMSAIAAAYTSVTDEGLAVPNPLYTNIGKLYSNENFARVLEALVDNAGGIIATMPAKEDMQNDYERQYIMKYLRGSVDGHVRTRILGLVKELAASSLAGYMLTLMIHAEGSKEASKLALLRDYSLAEAEQFIEKILSEE